MIKNIINNLNKNHKIRYVGHFRFCSKLDKGLHQSDKQIKNSSNIQEENTSNIQQYNKIFNDKIYKQNLELTSKLSELFSSKEESNIKGSTQEKQADSAKIFTAVNEINKVNLTNTTSLLDVFLNQVLKYNDSVKLLIQANEKKKFSLANQLTILFIWLVAGTYLYTEYKQRAKNNYNFKDFPKQYIDKSGDIFKTNINLKYPQLETIYKDFSNSINFHENNLLAIIGPAKTGKSEAVKQYCLNQNNKEILTFYFDLDTTNLELNFKDAIYENLKSSLNLGINNINNSLNQQFEAEELFKSFEKENLIFVFDNYNNKRDKHFVFNTSLNLIKNKV